MKKELIEELLVMLLSDKSESSDVEKSESEFIAREFIGKYVICRTRNEGVNFGKLESADQNGCKLVECRRLWRLLSKDKSKSWYEGISVSGVGNGSRLSNETTKIIIENYSLTIVSDENVITQIKGYQSNETSC